MKTKAFSLLLSVALVLGAFSVAPTTASADCSYNGYYHSNGRCSVSWKPRSFSYENYYSYNRDSMEQYIAYLEELIALLQGRLDVHVSSQVDVLTKSAVDIEEDSATLRGRVDLNNEDEAEVYFEYGRTRSLGDESRTRVIDEADDDDFEIDIDDLRDDTLYYFRAVAEDEGGDKDYGAILTFRTDEGDSTDNEVPDLDTYSATSITDDSAKLRGEVYMNDFNNGTVFFVYGEDENQVEDIADDYTEYSDIDEDNDDLQKTLLDSDLDSSATYSKTVTGLDDNTDIFYSICVEYDDEDDDPVIACGDVESFETD